GYWTDIGNINAFYEENLALTDEIPAFNLFDKERTIYTHARLLPPSKISGTCLYRSMVTEGCIINAKEIEHSVIGIRSRIGKDTTITNSYVMGNDHYQELADIDFENNNGTVMGIGERCFLDRCIVDKNCYIGNDVSIRGGDHLEDANNKLYAIKDGIVVIKKGAVLPNGFTI
nr:hypothetical protein [Prolixibacteraceae bacterium]